MSNILFICPNPVWGGAATATIEIAKMLQENGHNVIFNDEYSVVNEYNGMKIDHTPIHQKRFSDRDLLIKIITDEKIDCIIWSQFVAIYFINYIISLKKKGIKQISIVHSLSLKNNLKGRIMDNLVSLALACMTSIVFVSQYTKDSWNKFRIIRNSKIKQTVIHNIVNITNTIHQFPKGRPRIGFVGRLSEEKQPEVFCELSKNSNLDFIVYGNGPMMNDLKSKYPNVNFKGLCNDVNEIYSNIDVLVMTSKFENCPMAILEAQAFCIPCVAPEVGGIPEIVISGINGILYKDYQTTTIIKAIDNIILNYSVYKANIKKDSVKNTPIKSYSKWKNLIS